MRALISKAMALPLPGKAMIGMVLAGGIYGVFMLLGMPQLGFMLGIVMAVVTFVLTLFAFGMEKRDKKKADAVESSIADSAAATPSGVNKVADRAKLDDLRRQFEGGVQTFKDHGKNLYEMPWYVVVGEPGSGKTEAIRHSGIGFPPGLQDQLQGTGGTVNMNWWFTDQAVVLDTAGRLMFEDVAPGENNEWREFLKLLRTSRPNCPINGVLLVIPADTLITDRPDEIEKKAGKIAQQFDQIQRSLGVRFPVFVLISKADLINGFREFFEDITDPRLTAQMLGWANPADLDDPFKPDRVEEHLRTIRDHLLQRRFSLLQDPVHSEDPKGRRIDQVDALYKFPEAITEIAPRLRRYLETIFVAGEWSQKPLFLRGIFFTSSMRDGAALDADLAEALGVGVGALSEGKLWERERSYFLRDVFLDKVFKERGLVTRAANAGQVKRKRAMLLAGSAAVASLLLGAMIWYSYSQTQSKIQNPRDFWVSVRGAVEEVASEADQDPDLTKVGAVQRYLSPIEQNSSSPAERGLIITEPFESGNANIRIDGTKLTYLEVFERARRYYEDNSSSTGLFSLVAALPGGGKDIFKRQLPTQRLLFEQLVMAKAVDLVRLDILDGGRRRDLPIGWGAPDLGPRVLSSLISLEVDTAIGKGEPLGPESFADLIRLSIAEDPTSEAGVVPAEAMGELVGYYEWLYPSDAAWPPVTLRASSEIAVDAVTEGIASFNAHWRDPRGEGTLFGHLRVLREAADALSTAEDRLAGVSDEFRGVATEAGYQAIRARWIAEYDGYMTAYNAFARAFDPISDRFGGTDFHSANIGEEAYLAVWESAKDSYDGLLARFGDETVWNAFDPEKDDEQRLIGWRESLSDAKSDAESSYRQKADRLVADIRDSVAPRHLAMTGGSRAFLARKNIYDGARSAFDRAVPDAAALKDRMDAIDSGRLTDVRSYQGQTDAPAATAVGVFNAVARHLRYTGLAEEISRLQDWKTLLNNGAAPSLPRIPLTRLENLTYDVSLVPSNNIGLLRSFGALRERIAMTSDGGLPYALDGELIEAEIAKIEVGLSSHLADYQRFWTERVPAALTVRADPNVSWREMRSMLDTAHRTDESLEDLRDLMKDALGYVLSDPESDRDVKKLAEAVMGEADDDDLHDRIRRDLVPAWSGLSPDAARAGESLGRAAATSRVLMSRYFPLEPALDEIGPEAVYWRSFAVAAVEKIGDEAAGAEAAAVRGVEDDCRRFPITLTRAGGAGLTHARIEEIQGVLSGVEVLVSNREIVAGDRPFPDIRNDRIRDALDLIQGGSLATDPARVGRLRKALRTTTFLTENAGKITFTLAVQNLDYPANTTAGTDGMSQVQIEGKPSVLGEQGGYSLFQQREVFANYRWPLPLTRPVELRFADVNGAANQATLNGWEPLVALAGNRDEFMTGETVWPLPLRLGDGRIFWMGAVFTEGGAAQLADLKQAWLQDSDW